VINIRALNKHIIINRLSQLSLAILLLLFLASLLWFSDQQSQQLRQQQQQAVTELLKQQLGLAATMGLKLNQQQQLQWLAQSLSESPLLNGVWIHRADGTLMAESADTTPGESILLVTEVRQDKLLGYLKLSLNKSELIAPIVAIQQQQLQWHQWSLVLAGIIGFLLARALSQKRARYQLRNLVWRNQKKQAAKQQVIAHNSPDNTK